MGRRLRVATGGQDGGKRPGGTPPADTTTGVQIAGPRHRGRGSSSSSSEGAPAAGQPATASVHSFRSIDRKSSHGSVISPRERARRLHAEASFEDILDGPGNATSRRLDRGSSADSSDKRRDRPRSRVDSDAAAKSGKTRNRDYSKPWRANADKQQLGKI